MRLVSILCLVVCASCGDDGGGGIDASVANGIDAAVAAPDAMAAGEPCDFTNPQSVTVGQTVSSDAPSASCASGAHFYSFTPVTTGAYSIDKKGGGALGYCGAGAAGGCICGVGINCCAECVLSYVLVGGGDLLAGVAYEIYVDGIPSDPTYSFTITGPI